MNKHTVSIALETYNHISNGLGIKLPITNIRTETILEYKVVMCDVNQHKWLELLALYPAVPDI